MCWRISAVYCSPHSSKWDQRISKPIRYESKTCFSLYMNYRIFHIDAIFSLSFRYFALYFDWFSCYFSLGRFTSHKKPQLTRFCCVCLKMKWPEREREKKRKIKHAEFSKNHNIDWIGLLTFPRHALYFISRWFCFLLCVHTHARALCMCSDALVNWCKHEYMSPLWKWMAENESGNCRQSFA